MHIMAFLYQGTEAEVCAVIYFEFNLSYSFFLLLFLLFLWEKKM